MIVGFAIIVSANALLFIYVVWSLLEIKDTLHKIAHDLQQTKTRLAWSHKRELKMGKAK